MNTVSEAVVQSLRREWTDQFVKVNPTQPELRRFLKKHDKPGEDLIGRVITVNYNGKAVIDFQDGGWYDITASEEYLTKVPADQAKAKFDFKANSAQPIPDKQG
ncbi:MAG TPA: hypothetical protein VEL76_00705 [Gemmataceae bacterium]|nr:hypothetical protein [Gemmataceae bacterium]